MKPLPYRHIIWDWNGTLLDDLDYCVEVMNGVLQRHGRPLMDRARYHEVFGFPVRDYYARLGFDLSGDGFERLSVEFIAGYEERRWDCRLQPDARRILAAARAAGLTQSILSAYPHETLVELVDHFGLTEYFAQLSGLDNIFAHSKAELGRAQLAILGLPAREIVLVGDTLHDLEVAQELGVDCALVAAGHHPAVRLRARHDRVLNHLGELTAVLGLTDN